MSPSQLWDHFCVVGLNSSLVTVQGEQGWLGREHRYKPQLLDSLPHAGSSQVPPELPTCCLPAGVDIVLYTDVCGETHPTTQAFAFILTEGDGTKVYASCLAFHDRVPPELSCKHQELLGAKSLKAICLLSHQPYLQSTDQVLRELYRVTFWNGSSVPLPEVINGLLAVQQPQLGGPQVCLKLGHLQRTLCPPLAIGPPPGEMSLMPLLEVLRPDNLVALFAAVLLEQRVLLRSCQPWLLTVAAEGAVRLLYPLCYQHVYVPVMPYSLAEYLEAPTPFLMGLHSDECVDSKTLEGLVAVDLDNDRVSIGKDSGVLKRCLDHPYMKQLRNRIRMLLRPSTTDVDILEAPQDPWVNAARQLSQRQCSPLCKQALLIRIFMEFFKEVLDGYHQHLNNATAPADGCSPANSFSRGISDMQQQLRRVSSSAAQITAAAAAIAGSSSAPGFAVPRLIRRSSSSAAQPWMSNSVNMQALLQHHQGICRHSDPALLQQIMQGLPFMSFCDKQAGAEDPSTWLKAGKEALWAWRAAEEQLLTAQNVQPGSGMEVIYIPQQRCWPLMPTSGLLYSSFPALVTVDTDEKLGIRLKRRCSGSSKKRQTGLGVKRRAISELMGQQIDLWGKSPALSLTANTTLPLVLNTTSVLPDASLTAAGLGLTSALPNVGQLSSSSSTSGSPRHSKLGVEYSAEADLVRRQTIMLVQLMQSSRQGSDKAMSAEDLGAARLLLCVQTGGNGWFIVSKLKELVTTGGSCSGAAVAVARPTSQSVGSAGIALDHKMLGRQASISNNGAVKPKKKKQAIPCQSSQSEASLTAFSSRSAGSKTSSSKGGKFFGVGNSTSSASRRSGSPIQTRLAEGVDSLASAASAMASALSASVISRSGSLTRSRSPSQRLKLPPEHNSNGTQAATDDDAASRPGDEHRPHFLNYSATMHISNQAAAAAPVEPPADTVPQQQPAMASEAAAPVATSSNSSGMTAAVYGCLRQCVDAGVVVVLADMLACMIDTAAVQDDFKVVLAALELAGVITCQEGQGTRVPLIYRLAKVPVVHTEWFWAGAFSFAVSSSCLQAHEVIRVKSVVLQCLTDFARHMAGVGIAGYPAWHLLMALASEHLVNYGALDAHLLLKLRAQLATHESTAQQQLLASLDVAPPAAAAVPGTCSVSKSGRVTDEECMRLSQLQDNVAQELVACGVPVGQNAVHKANSQSAADASQSANPVMHSDGAAAPATEAHRSLMVGGTHCSFPAVPPQATDSVAGTCRRSCGKAAEEVLKASCHVSGAGGECQQASNLAVRGCAAAVNPAASWSPSALEDGSGSLQSAPSNSAPLDPGPEQSSTAVPVETAIQQAAVNLKAAAARCTAAAGNTSGISGNPSASSRRATGRHTPSDCGSSRFSPRSVESARGLVTPRSARVKQYAELHGRQNSPRDESNGSVAAAGAAEATTADAGLHGGLADALQVQEEGGSLLQSGAYHSATLHSQAVLAMDAASHILLSIGMEGMLKITDTSDGHMNVKAAIPIPAWQQHSSRAHSSGLAGHAVVKLWPDGQRAAIGNAVPQGAWVLDVQGARPTAQLTGLGSAVSAMHMLQRNSNSLLTALSCISTSRNSCSSSSPPAMAAVYLWDLRRPQRPAASLDMPGPAVNGPPAASAPGDEVDSAVSQAGCDSWLPASVAGESSAQGSGAVCLAVHSGGSLAAAGCQDGRVVLWDMRKPAVALATCLGHQGPVRHMHFATTGAAAAAADSLLVTGSDDWTVRVWDPTIGSCRASCVGHAAAITALQLVSDSANSRLVTGAADGSVGVWGLDGEVHTLSQQYMGPVQLLALGDCSVIAGAQTNHADIYSMPEVLTCGMHKPPPPVCKHRRTAAAHSMAYDPVGQLLTSGHRDGLVSIWSCRQ